jgi:hypothetical protein
MQSKFYRFMKQKNRPAPGEQRRMHDRDTSAPTSYSPRFGAAEWDAPG